MSIFFLFLFVNTNCWSKLCVFFCFFLSDYLQLRLPETRGRETHKKMSLEMICCNWINFLFFSLLQCYFFPMNNYKWPLNVNHWIILTSQWWCEQKAEQKGKPYVRSVSLLFFIYLVFLSSHFTFLTHIHR